ncbi:hypothetical protein ACFXTI_045814 [Malus domestica]
MYSAVDLGDCLVSSSVDLGWTHHNSSSLFYTQFCLVALLGLYIMVMKCIAVESWEDYASYLNDSYVLE